MANNIQALQKAGSNVIVDDISYIDEPMFQDGVISQAIDAVTANGVTYFSSAGNEGPDSGYLSTFRPASGNITGIGAGTFMNFNPNGGTNIELPITTEHPQCRDQFPVRPAVPGSGAGGLARHGDIAASIFTSSMPRRAPIVATGNQNNVAIAAAPAIGPDSRLLAAILLPCRSYRGANPGHIEFVGFNDTNAAITVSTDLRQRRRHVLSRQLRA